MVIEVKELPIDLNREYTAEEFAVLPDDGHHYELIEGKLVMTPPPDSRHGSVSDDLLTELKLYLRANPHLGQVWSHTGFNIGKKPNGKDNVLEPDLGFIVKDRLPPEDFVGYLPYPDLAVEVWSKVSDLQGPARLQKAREKLRLYLNAGTRLAWGINPATKEVEVYRQGGATPTVLGGNHELDGEDIIPGFRLKISELLK